jgi:hypothetical protein
MWTGLIILGIMIFWGIGVWFSYISIRLYYNQIPYINPSAIEMFLTFCPFINLLNGLVLCFFFIDFKNTDKNKKHFDYLKFFKIDRESRKE